MQDFEPGAARRSRLSRLLIPALLLTGLVAGPASAQAADTTYKGRATVVQATALGLAPIVLADTGALPSSGGAQEASLLSASVPGLLTANVLHATTVGQGNQTRSEDWAASPCEVPGFAPPPRDGFAFIGPGAQCPSPQATSRIWTDGVAPSSARNPTLSVCRH